MNGFSLSCLLRKFSCLIRFRVQLLTSIKDGKRQTDKVSKMVFSSSQCITLVVLFVTESVLIVTFNFITILLFVKSRNLRKRSMCLVLSLAIADMLVGGVSTSITITGLGQHCDIGKQGVLYYILYPFWNLFPIASLPTLQRFPWKECTQRTGHSHILS